MVFVILFGIVLLLAFQASRSIDLNPDGAFYIDIGRMTVREFRPSTGILHIQSVDVPDRFLYWPPMFPLILELISLSGVNPQVAYRVVVLLSTSLIVISLVFLAWKFGNSNAAVLALLSWLILFPRIASVYDQIVAEVPFVAFVMLAFCFAVQSPSQKTSLLAGLFTGFAYLTRNVGILLLIPFGFAILFQARRQNPSQAAIFLLLTFLSASLLMILPLLFYNYLVGGDPRGLTIPPPGRPLRNSFGRLWRTYLYALWPLLVLIPFMLVELLKHRGTLFENRKHLFITPIIFIILYLIILLYTVNNSRINRIGLRLLWPTFPFFVLLFSIWMRHRRLWIMTFILLGVGILSLFLNESMSNSLLFEPYDMSKIFSTRSEQDINYEDYKNKLHELTEWVLDNTSENTLIVMNNGWYIRLFIDRFVLTTGYHGMEVLQPENVCDFSQTHSFTDIVWIKDNFNVQEIRPLSNEITVEVVDAISSFELYELKCGLVEDE